ncbi:MAG: enolase C-terminal domain-like protein [Haloarculaceae archaeon]
MEIAEVEVIPVAHREPPLRNSWGAHSELAARTLVRLTTRDGLVGISETYGDPDVVRTLRGATDLLEGANPHERRPLRLRLQDDMAYGALEVAMYDLLGKEAGEPVHALLGGQVRDEVEYSGYLFYKGADSDPETAAITPQEVLSPEAMVEEAREFREKHGFEVLKLKGGVLPPEEELRTLELLAAEFGRDTPLRIDPNGAWSVETAIDLAKQLREMDLRLEFLEDPVPSMHAHAKLKRHVDYPVATNMFVTDFDAVAPAMDPPAVDVILSDHHYWGGFDGNLQLDQVARTFDLGVGMHSNSHLGVSMAAMTHVAAAMPAVRYACDTHYPWMADDVIADPPVEISDGTVDVPDDPGLGVELDEDRVERMHERFEDSETLGYSSVGSMAAAYADAMDDQREGLWLPDKPIW